MPAFNNTLAVRVSSNRAQLQYRRRTGTQQVGQQTALGHRSKVGRQVGRHDAVAVQHPMAPGFEPVHLHVHRKVHAMHHTGGVRHTVLS